MTLAGLFVLVALGGAVGGCLRFVVAGLLDPGGRLPWGTLVVNVTGSGAAGFLAAFLASPGNGIGMGWAGAGIGVLGSYTTVSAFALQTHGLARGGRWRAAAGYLALTVGLCSGAAAAGLWLGARW